MTLTSKLQRLAALRPLSPESVASLAAADIIRRHIPINFLTSGN